MILALRRLSAHAAKNSYRYLQLIIIEIALAFFSCTPKAAVVEKISGFFASLSGFAAEGTNFVFGGMSERLSLYFLGVLCPIVFIPR